MRWAGLDPLVPAALFMPSLFIQHTPAHLVPSLVKPRSNPQYLVKPVKVKIGRVSVPTANVSQSLERTSDAGQKLDLLLAMLQVRGLGEGLASSSRPQGFLWSNVHPVFLRFCLLKVLAIRAHGAYTHPHSPCALCPPPVHSSSQEEMEQSSHGGPEMPLTIVFVERKTRCDEVAAGLSAEGVAALALHGGLSQVRLGGAVGGCGEDNKQRSVWGG